MNTSVWNKWLVVGQHDAKGNLNIIREGFGIALDDKLDLYYCVAELKPGSTSRRKENALAVRMLVLDDVGTLIPRGAVDMMLPPPTLVVETSMANYQYGWQFEEPMPVLEYDALRTAMEAHPVWGKAHGKDAVHIFRMPMGVNSKPLKGGWKVGGKISKARLARDEAWSAFAPGAPEPLGAPADAAVPASLGSTVLPDLVVMSGEAVSALLDMVPNDAARDRDWWVRVGHGVFGATEGSDEGFEAFDLWSQTHPSYDAANTQKFWDSIRAGGVMSVGGLLKAAAEADDPKGFAKWKQEFEAGAVFDDGEVPPEEPPVGAGGEEALISPVQQEVADVIFGRYFGSLRYNQDSGCWHRFTHIWKGLPKSSQEGFKLAERWAHANKNDPRLGKAAFKEITKAGFYAGVETILRQRMAIRQEEFDRDPLLLGTPGGTVDLRTGVLRPAKAEDYISRCTSVTPSEREDCPQWKRFISEIVKRDLASSTFLQQWAGYNTTGLTAEQKFLFLHGPGGNGKSVFTDTLAWILGTYFAKPVADLYFKKTHQRHMQEVAMLAGARMIVMGEVPSGASWDESMLKEHTGGATVTANFMRENSFSFQPQFKLTVYGNHAPTFPGGISPAVKRRFVMMEMDFVPAVIDRSLMDKFKAEAPGILRWMINGYSGALGCMGGGLLIPAAVTATTEGFVLEHDPFGKWLAEATAPMVGGFVASADLMKSWQAWVAFEGSGSGMFDTDRNFGLELVKRGYPGKRTNTQKGFAGIVLVAQNVK